jgi:sn-glycerol 3-phosphate transport system permease protein
MNEMRTLKRQTPLEWIVTGITVLLAALWAVPIIWALIVSFRPPNDDLGAGDVWFGSAVTLESYQKATNLAPFFPDWTGSDAEGFPGSSYYANTLEWVLLALVVQVITVTLAGFVFAHFDFIGKGPVYCTDADDDQRFCWYQLVTIREFSPDVRSLNLSTTRNFHCTNNSGVPALVQFGTFLMRQAFLGVPKDLVEAGVMDGCRWYHVLWHVYLPPSYPSLVAFGLVSVSFHWNELLWPLGVTSDKARPLTMGLLRFTQLTDIGAQWAYHGYDDHHCPLMLAFILWRQFINSLIRG